MRLGRCGVGGGVRLRMRSAGPKAAHDAENARICRPTRHAAPATRSGAPTHSGPPISSARSDRDRLPLDRFAHGGRSRLVRLVQCHPGDSPCSRNRGKTQSHRSVLASFPVSTRTQNSTDRRSRRRSGRSVHTRHTTPKPYRSLRLRAVMGVGMQCSDRSVHRGRYSARSHLSRIGRILIYYIINMST